MHFACDFDEKLFFCRPNFDVDVFLKLFAPRSKQQEAKETAKRRQREIAQARAKAQREGKYSYFYF